MQAKTFGLLGAVFCAATLICPLNAFGQDQDKDKDAPPPPPKKGQDYPNEKCQRNEKDGTFTSGQCDTVCKDLVIGHKDTATGERTCKAPSTVTITRFWIPSPSSPPKPTN